MGYEEGYGGQYGGQDRGGFRPQRVFAPVKVGDELDVKIEAVGAKGDGIAKKEGFVLFVPGAKEGAEVRIKVTRVLRKVGFAEVLGDAQGEIQSDAPQESAPRDKPREQDPPPEEEPPQDTEDFGEEPADEEKE